MLWLLEWVVVVGYFLDTAHCRPGTQFDTAKLMPSLGVKTINHHGLILIMVRSYPSMSMGSKSLLLLWRPLCKPLSYSWSEPWLVTGANWSQMEYIYIFFLIKGCHTQTLRNHTLWKLSDTTCCSFSHLCLNLILAAVQSSWYLLYSHSPGFVYG